MTTLAAGPREWPKLFLGATTAIWIAVYQLLGLTESSPVRPQSLASRAAAWGALDSGKANLWKPARAGGTVVDESGTCYLISGGDGAD